MGWKEFFASLIDSLAWPVVVGFIVYLLREPLRKRIQALRRFRHRDTEFDFRDHVEEAVAAAAQAELPSGEPSPGQMTMALSTELAPEIASAPRAAVIAAWSAVERELEALASRVGIDDAGLAARLGGNRPVLRRGRTQALVAELEAGGVIDRSLAEVIVDLKRARDLAAHEGPYKVERGEVVDYVKLAGRVRSALRLAKQAQDAAMEGRTLYDLLVYHDLTDPTPSRGGTIPELSDNAEEWFGEIGRDRHVVAVGPGIHDGRVTVVLAHGARPMPEVQALLDRQTEQ